MVPTKVESHTKFGILAFLVSLMLTLPSSIFAFRSSGIHSVVNSRISANQLELGTKTASLPISNPIRSRQTSSSIFKLLSSSSSEYEARNESSISKARRDMLIQSVAFFIAGLGMDGSANVPIAAAEEGSDMFTSLVSQEEVQPTKLQDADGVKVFKTQSGLKYIEIKEGTGPQPRYGQFCSISYKASIKFPASSKSSSSFPSLNPLDMTNNNSNKPIPFETDPAYLLKHGSGRVIPGLDEGLHTMKVGGIRRLFIPPKLGYIQNGLGPIPASPLDRQKLNKLLRRMVELKGGDLVFDVELRSVMDDEADQGYYSDYSMSIEDFETLRDNIQKAGREARDARKNGNGSVGGTNTI